MNEQIDQKATITEQTAPAEAPSEVKQEVLPLAEEEKKEDQNAKIEESRKKLEEYYKTVTQKIKENIDKVRTPQKEDHNLSLSHIFDEKRQVDFSSLKLVKCLEYIGLSDFNPVPPNRKTRGDLLYLKLKTLEGHDFQITCN